MDQVKDSTLQMQESIGAVINTSKGQILRQRPGMLYVNGLLVCTTDMKVGYNIKPEFLKLERDRQTVSSFDLAWITKEMWFESGLVEEVSQMMADKSPDMQYANYNTPEVVKEACYQHFQREYPGHVMVNSQKELDALVKQGMTKVRYYERSPYTEAVHSARSYTHVSTASQTPTQFLEEWFRANRGNMRTPAIISFKELVTKSSDWRISQ
jgi:hypothetical protein